MVDLGFDILLAGITLRVGVTIVTGHIETIRHIGGGLFDDAQALTQLFKTDQIAGIATAAGSGGDIEIEAFVAGIGHLFAQVPFQAAGAQVGSGHAPVDRLIKAGDTDAFGACPEDRPIGEHAVKFIDALVEITGEDIHRLFPAVRQIHRQTADTEPGRVHAAAGNLFDDVEDLLA